MKFGSSTLHVTITESHPTGVRGLKFSVSLVLGTQWLVAPHWGAWIEIIKVICKRNTARVAPHWGAWIEISKA